MSAILPAGLASAYRDPPAPPSETLYDPFGFPLTRAEWDAIAAAWGPPLAEPEADLPADLDSPIPYRLTGLLSPADLELALPDPDAEGGAA
jgi:hypothetical protein